VFNATFQQYFSHIVRGCQYYWLRKPWYPLRDAYSTWKSLSHEDVSVNNNKSYTFFRNYKELQKEPKQKQTNKQTGKGNYIIRSDMCCCVSSFQVVVVIVW
jgi:hypothetical protein